MPNFEITLASNVVHWKVDGKQVGLDLTKVHPTWLGEYLAYGAAQKTADKFASIKGNDKYLEVCAWIDALESGDVEYNARSASSVSVDADPVTTLAVKNAKAALVALFKQLTKANKALAFAQNAKCAPFFQVSDDKATWRDDIVVKWIEKQAADGKADYMADAKATLDAAEDDGALDF